MVSPPSFRNAAAPALVAAIAFASRALWTLYVRFDPLANGRFDDSVFYHEAARYVARGEGLINPWSGLPTALWPPGYPFFLGALYRIFPDDPLVAGLANALLGGAAALGVYALGRAAGGVVAGLASGLTFALLPGQVVFSSLTMSETLSTATLVFLALAALRWNPARRGPVAALALGAGVGMAAFVRGQALILLPVFGLFWWLRGAPWKQTLLWGTLATFGALAVLAPWAARNLRELGRPILVSSNLGGNLWMGHHDGATGGMDPHVYPESFDHLPPERQEAARAQAMLEDGLRFMVTHPLEEARLAVNKVRLLWESDTVGFDWNEGYGRTPIFDDERGETVRAATNGAYFAVLALGAAGLLVGAARRNAAAALLTLLAALWTAGHVLFFGDPRFHVPVMFAVCVGVGVTAGVGVELARRLAGRKPRLLFAGAS
ncbi:MAG TPA: hypothetical protein VNM43_09730 [Dehalococcoidia bacterium]|nr:hypothetical protein [Dehalococcoidia bacterium]